MQIQALERRGPAVGPCRSRQQERRRQPEGSPGVQALEVAGSSTLPRCPGLALGGRGDLPPLTPFLTLSRALRAPAGCPGQAGD